LRRGRREASDVRTTKAEKNNPMSGRVGVAPPSGSATKWRGPYLGTRSGKYLGKGFGRTTSGEQQKNGRKDKR